MKNSKKNISNNETQSKSPFGNRPFFKPLLQTQLMVNAPGDKYEVEADRMANKVAAMSNPGLQRQADPEREEDAIQQKPLADQISPLVQRQGPEDEEEPLQMQGLLQKQDLSQEEEKPLQLQSQTDIGPTPASSGLTSQLNQAQGGGQPLPQDTEAFMSQAFGYDFGEVRIHTDKRAQEMNQELNARAFTHGKDVFFNTGQFAPTSPDGKKLLGHELTHVVQSQHGNQVISAKNNEEKSKKEFKIAGYNHYKWSGEIFDTLYLDEPIGSINVEWKVGWDTNGKVIIWGAIASSTSISNTSSVQLAEVVVVDNTIDNEPSIIFDFVVGEPTITFTSTTSQKSELSVGFESSGAKIGATLGRTTVQGYNFSGPGRKGNMRRQYSFKNGIMSAAIAEGFDRRLRISYINSAGDQDYFGVLEVRNEKLESLKKYGIPPATKNIVKAINPIFGIPGLK